MEGENIILGFILIGKRNKIVGFRSNLIGYLAIAHKLSFHHVTNILNMLSIINEELLLFEHRDSLTFDLMISFEIAYSHS